MPEQREMLIEATGVELEFSGRTVLENAAASVRSGEIVTLIGPNGAGKTSMIKVMLGLLKPRRGDIYRRHGLRIGYMPQRLTIDPSLPLTVNGFLDLGLARRQSGAGLRRQALQEVGIGRLAGQPVQGVSGGELQRVLLARALLRDPDLLVLDEPVQGVDAGGQAELYALIRRLRDQRGCGVLMISHDLHMVMAATDRVVCLNRHVCCAGHPETVRQHPEFVSLFGPEIAAELAVYHHHHDHHHDVHGDAAVPVADG